MTGILQAAGLSGVTLLVVAAVGWLAVRGTDALVQRAVSAQQSELRQAEARWTSALGSRADLELDLRQKRDALYRSLWPKTQVLSLTPINKELTYADVSQLSITLKDWYFTECGGLYLSVRAQRAYREAQEALTEAAGKDAGEHVWREPRGDDYERLRLALSSLRTALTEDLQSRIAAPSLEGPAADSRGGSQSQPG